MKKIDKSNELATLAKLYKDLQAIYTLTEIEQEALDLCRENEKDPTHVITLTDIILDKFRRTLSDLHTLLNEKT